MELRPFRSLRYAPRVIADRGLPSLIAPPGGRVSPETARSLPAPENILRITRPPDGDGPAFAASAATLERWLAEGVLLKERRPGLWIYRQTPTRGEERLPAPLLVGLVRLGEAGKGAESPPDPAAGRTREERLAMRRALKADFEPCLLVTRAPLSGALATTRRPDLSAEDLEGARHDLFRINDYAQHVELQGLVKNAEVVVADRRDLWEAARQFEKDPEAARLPGAKFKLCAILEETFLRANRGAPLPKVYAGFFGVSLEDPVY